MVLRLLVMVLGMVLTAGIQGMEQAESRVPLFSVANQKKYIQRYFKEKQELEQLENQLRDSQATMTAEDKASLELTIGAAHYTLAKYLRIFRIENPYKKYLVPIAPQSKKPIESPAELREDLLEVDGEWYQIETVKDKDRDATSIATTQSQSEQKQRSTAVSQTDTKHTGAEAKRTVAAQPKPQPADKRNRAVQLFTARFVHAFLKSELYKILLNDMGDTDEAKVDLELFANKLALYLYQPSNEVVAHQQRALGLSFAGRLWGLTKSFFHPTWIWNMERAARAKAIKEMPAYIEAACADMNKDTPIAGEDFIRLGELPVLFVLAEQAQASITYRFIRSCINYRKQALAFSAAAMALLIGYYYRNKIL